MGKPKMLTSNSINAARDEAVSLRFLCGERTGTLPHALGHENIVIYFICPSGKGDNIPLSVSSI